MGRGPTAGSTLCCQTAGGRQPGSGRPGYVSHCGFRQEQTELVFYSYDPLLDLIRRNGQAPGRFGSATDSDGTVYFFGPDGWIVGAELDGVAVMTTPSGDPLFESLVVPGRNILFDIDPATGVVSNLRDLSGPAPQGLAFLPLQIPEPGTALLVGLGLVGLGMRRRSD